LLDASRSQSTNAAVSHQENGKRVYG